MHLTIKSHKVVFYYDEPLVITSEVKESEMSCISIKTANMVQGVRDHWLSCFINKEELNRFLKEGKDLLSIINQPTTDFGQFYTEDIFEDNVEYIVESVDRSELKSEWLPGSGFHLRAETKTK